MTCFYRIFCAFLLITTISCENPSSPQFFDQIENAKNAQCSQSHFDFLEEEFLSHLSELKKDRETYEFLSELESTLTRRCFLHSPDAIRKCFSENVFKYALTGTPKTHLSGIISKLGVPASAFKNEDLKTEYSSGPVDTESFSQHLDCIRNKLAPRLTIENTSAFSYETPDDYSQEIFLTYKVAQRESSRKLNLNLIADSEVPVSEVRWSEHSTPSVSIHLGVCSALNTIDQVGCKIQIDLDGTKSVQTADLTFIHKNNQSQSISDFKTVLHFTAHRVECRKDSHCTSDDVCVLNRCEECEYDHDCSYGQVCNSNYRCIDDDDDDDTY
ncbi:MAG: hypothetical protein CL678_07190 [Bdellovibrionaceae bacterium]|nr:hypothetical protein [Pseudobdellovibrionaceae bacterium]|tara:strand:+ start:1768 stop:2751 length:984 start_codon:yes stop_codon:yes gene_type:complete